MAFFSSKQSSARQIVRRSFAIVFIFMAGVALLFGAYSLIANSSLFIPRSTTAILDDVFVPDKYGWSSESIRLPEVDGLKLSPQSAARGIIVNTDINKFVVIAAGVEPDRVFYTSDGRFTVRLDERAAAENSTNWTLVSDVCADQPALEASTVTMPGPEDFRAANPDLQSDQATVFGERAWRISFQGTPQIVEKLMLLPFFTEATRGERSAEWVISETERKMIAAGQFTTEQGVFWVNRDGQRQIQQIDLSIALESGSKYRFLAQRTVGDIDTSLDGLDHGDDNCQLQRP